MIITTVFTKASKSAGVCSKRRSEINRATVKISRVLAQVRSEEETKNTIVHELCHAYNNYNDGHGYYWKRIAKTVGDALGFKITRVFNMTADQHESLREVNEKSLKSPVALLEVPEIGYKKYIYKKSRGYYAAYKGWFVRQDGKKYDITFTKLR